MFGVGGAALAVPPGFSNELVVPDIATATTIAFLPDGRMLVGELQERIYVVQPGPNPPAPSLFLQLPATGLIDEQGLMDVLPDPDFASNQYYYVFYTRDLPGPDNRNRVSRFTASGNGTVPGSELVLWQDDVIAQEEHHGGSLAIGTDGKLYITYGDQFIAASSQQLNSYRGKLLRINLDGTIPLDNPFHDGAGPNKDEIWAYGLRNPFRMSIDPVTGRIFIGDVGGNDSLTAWEEVNLGAAGANYGWPLCEGDCNIAGVTDPIYTYPHLGRDASITGGFVYRGTQFPVEYQGSYFFADFAQNWIKRLTFDAGGNVTGLVNFEPFDGSLDGPYGDPVKLLQGPDGSLYYVDIGFNSSHQPNESAVRRIRYTFANQPPVAVANATPLSGPAPLQVSFSSAGSFDPEGVPLTYAWIFGDGGTSNQANPTHIYTVEGPYVARLTVSDGVSPTLSSVIQISVGNPPTATILSPVEASLFRAGDAIGYSGSATDPEDGALPASAFSWSIFFHHDSHVHPAGGPFPNTTSGSLPIPTTGHGYQGLTRYEIVLTVTDSDGLQGTDSVTVFPDKVDLTFTSVPSGLELEVDGIRQTTPYAIDDLIGFWHVINAPAQSSGGTTYVFQSWSDGGAASHSIVVPTQDASWQATFRPGPMAAYGFEEGSGSATEDVSGNDNDGVLVGGTNWTSNGRFGNALVFDGSSAFVQVPDSDSLDLSTEMTLSAWVYPTVQPSSRRAIVQKEVDAYFLLAGTSASRVGTGGTFDGVCCSLLEGPSGLPVNEWSHVAGTYDGATLRLFVNGTQVASQARTGNLQVNTGELRIGGNTHPSEFFTGRIDEVRIYDVALDPSEIQTDMATPIPEAPSLQQLGAGAFALALLARGRARWRRASAREAATR